MKTILDFKVVQAASLVQSEEETSELFKIAEKRGYVVPSPHLAIFKTVYAKIEEPNRNKVRLERNAVMESLPTLIGKQVNLNHWRKGFIVGHIIDATLNEKDEIEVSFVFYKDVYIEDFQRAIDQFADGELTVSFELYAEGREDVGDGTVRLSQLIFAGMGLLLDEDPAYPGAIVFEMAKKIKDRIHSSTGLVFAKEIETSCDKIILALAKKYQEDTEKSEDIDESTHHDKKKDKKLKNKEAKEGGNPMPKITEEQIKALKNELGDLCKDWTTEDFENENKISEARAIVADLEDQDSESPEETEEVVEEATDEDAKMLQKTTETRTVEIEADENTEKVTEKSERTTETTYDLEEVEDVATEEATEESEETEAEEETEEVAETGETEAEETSDEATEEEAETTEEAEEETTEAETTEEVVEEATEVPAEDIEELKAKISELESALEQATAKFDELEASIESIKEQAIKVAEYKKTLGDYVKDYTEADFLNTDKIRLAEQAKELDELRNSKKGEETETPEVAADTGHDADDVDVEENPTKKLLDIRTSKDK